VDARGRIVRVHAGDWRAAHRLACAEYVSTHTLPIAGKRPLVVASCGGWPYDANLIQAHKALDMATHACTEGGDIVLVAECAEGFGRADFLKWFDAEDSRALGRRLLENYEVSGQTAWALLAKAERFRVHLVSKLGEEDARRMRMTPARTLDEALSRAGGDAQGFVMPRGAAIMPVRTKETMNAER
jgi:nickel-dependent lactate racemase